MSKEEYFKKFKDPRWQKRRLEIMNRDEFACRECNSEENTLNVHHIVYCKEYKNPWDYPDELLITLCERCHGNEHRLNQYDIANDILKYLIILSNKPLSKFNISTDIRFMMAVCDYEFKEAIKHVLLEYIRNL